MPGPLSFDNIMIGNPALTRSRVSAPSLVRALIKPEQVSPDNPIGATKARAGERRSPWPNMQLHGPGDRVDRMDMQHDSVPHQRMQ
ncbi:MAG: hypothetical protein JO283_03365 [Bradyrhizobium sp.]|nr:hypothetical protein [Bradyrhizobium sp.]